MLFYIDEFPEKRHHPKESNLLLPRVARLGWELIGEIRRTAFEANREPLATKGPRDPVYDRLFTRKVMRAPAPIGVGGA